MPRHLIGSPLTETEAVSSAGLVAALAAADFSKCSATVIGYGKMGREYVKALRALKVPRIRVCSRNSENFRELKGIVGFSLFGGGYQEFEARPGPEELAILAIPIADLGLASRRLAGLGYRKLLIEKPVSLWAGEIEQLDEFLNQAGLEAAVAYNRVAYPSLIEAAYRTQKEGGVTSCAYTFTEFIHKIDLKRYTKDELSRWGIANSLHVVSMAHGLIGEPESWSGYRSGSLDWHPAGRCFVGSGLSMRGIPFVYQADWGSTGRWSVELHTRAASYRLCPLEQLQRRVSATSDWEPVPVSTFDPGVKVGFVEEVAAMLDGRIQSLVPLVSLKSAAALTRYGEKIFGYSESR